MDSHCPLVQDGKTWYYLVYTRQKKKGGGGIRIQGTHISQWHCTFEMKAKSVTYLPTRSTLKEKCYLQFKKKKTTGQPHKTDNVFGET